MNYLLIPIGLLLFIFFYNALATKVELKEMEALHKRRQTKRNNYFLNKQNKN